MFSNHICTIFPCGLTYNQDTERTAASTRALATKDIYNTADTVNVWVCVNAELMQHGTKREPWNACCKSFLYGRYPEN